MFLRLFSICLLFISSLSCYEIALTAIFRDEARFLKEWIEYHRLIGVEHFYLTNHKSVDHFQEVLDPYIEMGLVELRHETKDTADGSSKRKKPLKKTRIPVQWNNIQITAYQWALEKAQQETKWLVAIDIDEFLVPKNGETLNGILKGFQHEAAVAINWQMFGTSDVEKIPEGKLMIETLLLRAPRNIIENTIFKPIVQPKMVAQFFNPHQCVFSGPYRTVDMAGHPVKVGENVTNKVEIDRIQLNHYWSRDLEFYHTIKLSRSPKMGQMNKDLQKRLDLFNTEPDDSIVPFIPALKENMGI